MQDSLHSQFSADEPRTVVGAEAEADRQRQSWVATARAVVPLLAAHAQETDALGRLAEESLTALRESGLLRLGVPRALGGHGAGVRAAFDVCAEMARGCGSSSWIVGVAYGGNICAALLDDEARTRLWGSDPDGFVCGSSMQTGTATAAPGGVVVSGKWAWASGVHHAGWVSVGLRVTDADGRARAVAALMPRSAVTVENSWHMAGMRGTGSDTVVVDDVFVPRALLIPLSELRSGEYRGHHPDEPFPVLPMAVNFPLAGVAVGLAHAAFDETVALLAGKRAPTPLHPTALEVPGYQTSAADAAVLLDAARMHGTRAADDLDRAAAAHHTPDVVVRARIRLDAVLALEHARACLELLMNVAGASAFADAHPLQRVWRDLATASRHAGFRAESAREIYGKALIGAPLPPELAV